MDLNLYKYDDFMSFCLNRRVYSLKQIPESYKIDGNQADFIYCRTPSIDFSNHKKLIQQGFNLIDVNVKLKYIFKKQIDNYFAINIREVNKADRNMVSSLAENSFIYDRFHKDIEIPNNMASDLKKRWVDNFFKGKRGNNLLVSDINGVLAGFILLIENKKEVIIDLIAVNKDYRKLGVAMNLIKESFNIYKENQKNFIVTTQITNIASLNLYQKIGFRIIDTNYVWHWHRNKEFES